MKSKPKQTSRKPREDAVNQTRAAVAYLNSDSVRSKELEYTAFLTVVHGMDPDKARKRAREIVAKT